MNCNCDQCRTSVRSWWDRDEPGLLSTLHVILAWGISLGIIYIWLR